MSARLEQLQRLAAAEPGDPLTHYALGLELAQLGRLDEALVAFDRALAADAHYHSAHLQKARVEVQLRRHATAAQTLRAGIAAAEAQRDRHAADEMRKYLEALA